MNLRGSESIRGLPRGGWPLLYTAIGVAFVIWFFLFAVPGTPFWGVIAPATFVLGGGALLVYRDTLQGSLREWLGHLALGLLAAGALYLIFALGNQLVRILPFMNGGEGVENVYATKTQASSSLIGALLLFPIGPGEELFWRAWVQRAMMHRFGAWKGFALTTLLYSAVHFSSLNLTLIAAATVAGIFWGILYLKVGHVGPGVVSHALWDAAVFIWFPFV